ncbi:alpha/beta fold hydrolase [Paenibacillus sp. HN-1]|uniref:RBBP9/YdeN family alpha/beta hydrolase n=1 Tax=Paenibacillus TaxID=44249 RepID=UPI001CA860E4|nr:MULTISPECIES: alpha/beta fold hydrolase [Paenibacillus]MBY9078908.1 alpha/beta fold hydrolase [Paenibacillus sp. CGMCC 1.18879]MBY9087621.1 alpha/beta fold hydrolase [Paenibacillus sinensis]
MKRSYLILYGLGGSGPEHWQSWLYEELIARGERVYYPDFPDYDHPVKSEWMRRLAEVLETIPEEEELTVVAHSLGCILWFHYAIAAKVRLAKSLILVCPPSIHTRLEEVASFFPVPDSLDEVGKSAENGVVVLSTDDPYCRMEDLIHYQRLHLPSVLLPGVGHLNVASGYGPWPEMLELCLDGRFRLWGQG